MLENRSTTTGLCSLHKHVAKLFLLKSQGKDKKME